MLWCSDLPCHLLLAQAGAFGGIPGGGLRFGSSHNPACLVPTASMIDFYNGSGVDVACLGLAEVRGWQRLAWGLYTLRAVRWMRTGAVISSLPCCSDQCAFLPALCITTKCRWTPRAA